jgi:PEP-CTERM motif
MGRFNWSKYALALMSFVGCVESANADIVTTEGVDVTIQTSATVSQDAFVHFNSAGVGIRSIAYSSTLGRINPMDDFSFVTATAVPEPSTIAMLGVALVVGWRARRRFSGLPSNLD